jgi:hypothetical protein
MKKCLDGKPEYLFLALRLKEIAACSLAGDNKSTATLGQQVLSHFPQKCPEFCATVLITIKYRELWPANFCNKQGV